MKRKSPYNILSEKIKVKDEEISFLKNYIKQLNKIIITQGEMIECQEKCLQLKEEILKLYKL